MRAASYGFVAPAKISADDSGHARSGQQHVKDEVDFRHRRAGSQGSPKRPAFQPEISGRMAAYDANSRSRELSGHGSTPG